MKGKKRYIKLTEKQRLELQRGFKKGKKATFRKRCHFILLSDQGYSIKEISQMYGVTRQSVATWFDRYEHDEIRALHTQRGQGRKAILRIDNKIESQRVEELLEEYAQNLQPVLHILEKEFGKVMSKRTLQRFLKKKDFDGKDFVELQQENLTNSNII